MKDDLMSVKPILHNSWKFLPRSQAIAFILKSLYNTQTVNNNVNSKISDTFCIRFRTGSRDQLADNAWNGVTPGGFIELTWITFLNNFFLPTEKFPIFWLLDFSYKSKHNLAVHHIEGFTLRRPRSQKHITYSPQQVTKLNVFKARIQNDSRNWL